MSSLAENNFMPDDSAESVRAIYEGLCRDLNMDSSTEVLAFKKYKEVAQRCSLEGDIKHWFCCVLYATGRVSATPTVGGSDEIVMGNGVPLTNLLRSCNMSIYEFTTKIKLWADMANLSPGFLTRIKEMEAKFSITFTLFQRYKCIFKLLFVCPQNERKNTKFSSVNRCTFGKLYDFCWHLFLSVKNQKPTSTVDLVTSFHLLICCLDLVYINVLSERRTDLINPEFKGVPKHWNTPEFDVNNVQKHCIINELCEIEEALNNEALNIKKTSWCTTIETLFKTNTLYGNPKTYLGLVSNLNIDRNLKSLNSAYQQNMLCVGEFDERILVNSRIPNSLIDSSELSERDGSSGVGEQAQELLITNTPYTRQQSLPLRQEHMREPVANATNNVKQLFSIAHIQAPTEFIQQAGEATISKIQETVSRMSQTFINAYPNKNETEKPIEAENRFKLATSLYYFLLDTIIRAEKQKKPNIDLKSLLGQHTFNQMLLACCVLLVLEAYGSKWDFKWVLKCFGISPFDFTKIIEIVVRNHDNILTRELIKHLNKIEETFLESATWVNDSPLWGYIQAAPKPLATWSEVNGDNTAAFRQTHSPMISSPTAYESFKTTPGRKSPPQMHVNDAAKRVLFNTNKTEKLAVPGEKPTTSKPSSEAPNKRSSCLTIFFRKFYMLAWIRISKLCSELGMTEKFIQKKIWTLFENSITDHTHLMKDRHLDQLLMCAIYIYIRVADVPCKKFADIMKFYRKQPQSNSSVYRAVLIEWKENEKVHNDLIYFYNHVYVPRMTNFSLNFNEKRKSESDLLLSPHPEEAKGICKQLTQSVSVAQMAKNSTDIQESPNQMIYEFGKNPTEASLEKPKLQHMNEKVSCGGGGGKRALAFNDDVNFDQKRPRDVLYLQSIKNIMADRQKESH